MNQEGGGKNGSEESKPDPLAIAGTPANDSGVTHVEVPAHPPVVEPNKNVSPKVPDNKGNKEIKKRNPLLVRVIEDDELNAFERKTVKYAMAGFAVGLITIFLAGLTTLIFYGQFKEAASQTDLLDIAAKQARRDSAAAGLRAEQEIAALQAQATAAKNSVETIQRQMKLDQRPWVKFDFGEPDSSGKVSSWMRVGDPMNIPIRLTNTGKTPAKHVEATVYVDILPKNQIPRLPVFQFKGKKPPKGAKREVLAGYTITTGRIFAGNHAYDTVGKVEVVNGALRPAILSVPEANALARKDSYMIMYGRVCYSDGFGIAHWSTFCNANFIDGQSANITKCSNYADDDNN